MNKVMKITLAASAMLAISFTLGCSNDKDDDSYCVLTYSGAASELGSICYELDKTYTAEICKASTVKGYLEAKTTSSKPKDIECVKFGK